MRREPCEKSGGVASEIVTENCDCLICCTSALRNISTTVNVVVTRLLSVQSGFWLSFFAC